MIEWDSTDRLTICGLPGTGKTVLADYLAHICEPNLLIYDPLAQYKGFPEECIYIPKSDSMAEFEEVCGQLCNRSNFVFLIEEVERYLGQGKTLGPNAFDLINRGRNWGAGIIAVTRRIQKLSKDYFDLCQKVILFRCGLKSREYIADMTDKKMANRVIHLPKHHFVYYNVEEEKSEVSTLDLSDREKAVPDPKLISLESHVPPG